MKQLKYVIGVMSVCVSFLYLSETATAQTLAWPVGSNCGSDYSNITSEYAPRGETGHFHDGIDISCGGDLDILAAHDGTVSYRSTSTGQCEYSAYYGTCPNCDNGLGNSIRIDDAQSDLQTRYLHMREVYVSVGDSVTCGQVIGKMGTTGCSTGQHLHFSVYSDGSQSASPWDYVQRANYTCPVGFASANFETNNTDIDGDGKARAVEF